MKDPILFRRTDTLSASDCSYWKDLLYRVAKIGTEIEVAPPMGTPRPVFEARVREALEPSGSLERLGHNGVLDIITEHAGIEVRAIGRQPYFSALYKQYSTIFNILLNQGGRPRATCGLHFHLLTPTLAEPVPEIILANLWNLVRRYAPELRWLTSTGARRDALCRHRMYCSHLEMVRHSPGTMRMQEIFEILKTSKLVPEHQNFINLQHLAFDEQGNILPFHIEFRFPDANLSALAVTAQVFLFLALLLKSVDMSQYGVIHVGKIQPWRRKAVLLDLLSNDDGNYATSDTQGITPEVMDELRAGAGELLDLLAPTLNRFQGAEAFQILLKLARTPISLLRSDGMDWTAIEQELRAGVYSADEVELDQVDHRLMKYIDLGEWVGYGAPAGWAEQAAYELSVKLDELQVHLDRLNALRGVTWDSRQGTMVFTG